MKFVAVVSVQHRAGGYPLRQFNSVVKSASYATTCKVFVRVCERTGHANDWRWSRLPLPRICSTLSILGLIAYRSFGSGMVATACRGGSEPRFGCVRRINLKTCTLREIRQECIRRQLVRYAQSRSQTNTAPFVFKELIICKKLFDRK